MKYHYTKSLLLAILMLAVGVSLQAQINLTNINSPYTEAFNSLASAGTANDIGTLPVGWTFAETGTSANTTYAASTGQLNTGNTYSFGVDASDRAFGALLSGSLSSTIGASFVNHTGTAINEIHIQYKGEEWRLGTLGRADRLDFQYSLNATSLATGTWVDVNTLDFSSPNTTTGVGLLNGNSTLNSTGLDFIISGLSIESGSSFFIRWLDFNATGADDGLAVDDFTVTPIGVPANQPAITFVPSNLNFGDVKLNTSVTASYRVKGANLDTVITAWVADPSFSLSVDGTNFTSSVTLSDTGAVVIVRFTPTHGGIISDSVFHSSTNVSASLRVKGSGFNQADHIIPIAVARTQALGTQVTVAGRITVANELGNPAYIQDGTGGIPIFDYTLAHSVTIGDSVIATGPIGIFSNQKQISGTGIFFTISDTTKRIIKPKSIGLVDLATNEGLLVTVQNVDLIDKNFVFYPQSTAQITSSGVISDLRIDGDTNIPGLTKPQGTVNITGVVGRFNTNVQLLPRFRADIPGANEPAAVTDSIPKNKTLDVVTWNLEFFGARKEDYLNQEFGPADEDLQLQNVKKNILTMQADIIGIEEVSNDSLFASLISQLPGYAATCSNRYSYSFNGPDHTFPPQKVCFIYDTATIKILSSRAMFESLYDSARTINPSILPNYPGGTPSSFWSSGRLPYLIKVKATINGVTEKINFIDIHAKSGATAADRDRRVYDAKILKDSLDTYFANEKVLLVGDYNDDLDSSIVVGSPSSYANFVKDANYIPITKTLSKSGARSTVGFTDMIDHIIASNDLQEEYLIGSEHVITPFRLIPNYGTTTSDHLAVATRFIFKPAIISFTKATATVSEDTATYVVNVTLSKPLLNNYNATIALSGDATYGLDFGTIPAATNGKLKLLIPAGSTTAFFTISIINDKLDELAEHAIFTIQATPEISLGTAAFSLTIEDNDIVEVSFASLATSGDEGSGPHHVKLTLSTPPATNESVTIKVYEGPGITNTDYTLDPIINHGTMQVDVAAGSTEAFFIITPLADFKHEFKYETILFDIQTVTSGLKIKNPRITTFSIIDVKNSPPKFFVFPNPTFGGAKLLCDQSDFAQPLDVVLRTANGDVIYHNTGTLNDISDAINHKIQSARIGVLVLTVSTQGETTTLRILKL